MIAKPPRALTWSDYNRVTNTIQETAHQQLGLFAEPFDMKELADLFCPPSMLASLRQVYDIEDPYQARGQIHVDCASMVAGEQIFDDDDLTARCECTRAVLRIRFDREKNPGGFVTPTPVFGDFHKPVDCNFKGPCATDAHQKFTEEVQHLIKIMGRWSMVNWTLQQLQGSLRSPSQMRYVWPAIYTLASKGELTLAREIVTASARAGMNANPSSECKPFLRPTNDVVVHSVLMEQDEDMIRRWSQGQLNLLSCTFNIYPMQGSPITINGL